MVRLYGCFLQKNSSKDLIQDIFNKYLPRRIFKFNVEDRVFISFNSEIGNNSIYGVFAINRIHSTNTLFTINALNLLTGSNPDVRVNWKKYTNFLILVTCGELVFYHLEFDSIITF